MSRFINGTAFYPAASFNIKPENYKLSTAAVFGFSDEWRRLGWDVLWSRPGFMGAGTWGGGSFWGLVTMSWGDSWDVIPYMDEGAAGGKRQTVFGVTRDGSGNPLASCKVYAFDLNTLTLVDQTTSDANGNYTVTTPYDGATLFLRTFLGSTPAWGSSNNLTPS